MDPRKKVIYVVSDIDKALEFEWVTLYLRDEFDIQFILIGPEHSALSEFLRQQSIPCYVIADKNFSGRLSQWFELIRLLFKEKPAVVHTHLWRANILGLTASWLLRVPRRMYTRHHATLHHREYPSGLKWDKLCNGLATDIVAISESIEQILVEWDKVNPKKIILIPHGFDFEFFERVSEERISNLRLKLNIVQKKNYPVVGVISRYTHWKGIQFIIPAFKVVLEKYPGAVLVLANARGDYETEIKALLTTLPKKSYREVEFEHDLGALYRQFNVFVHVPTDEYAEAFGQTYVEALIVGVPSVFTLSGAAKEFIKDRYNALLVDFKNSPQIAGAILSILENEILSNTLISNGRSSVEPFRLEYFISNLKRLYHGE